MAHLDPVNSSNAQSLLYVTHIVSVIISGLKNVFSCEISTGIFGQRPLIINAHIIIYNDTIPLNTKEFAFLIASAFITMTNHGDKKSNLH